METRCRAVIVSGAWDCSIAYYKSLSVNKQSRSLSDLGNRSENLAGRGQILSILQGNSCSIAPKSGGIWTVQTDLQQICPKSDRLLGSHPVFTPSLTGPQSQNPRRSLATPAVLLNQASQILHKSGRDRSYYYLRTSSKKGCS